LIYQKLFVKSRKIKYVPKSIKIVGISSWLSNQAKQSKLLKSFDIRTIYNKINSNDFYPINKE